MSYHHHRQSEWGRNPKLERAVTAIIFAVVIGALVVFLVVYHDLPFRIS